MKNLIKKLKKMPTSKKIQVIVALLLMIALIAIIPVYAWFTNERKAAEMYKVQYPNSLYINAAHREDRAYCDLDGINVNNYIYDGDGRIQRDDVTGEALRISTYRYVFAVSGDNTTTFKLQMAHTNNNRFTYTIYNASQYDYPMGTATREADEEQGIEAITADQIVPAGTSPDNIVPFVQHSGSHTENTIQVAYDPYVEGDTSTKYYVKGSSVNGSYQNNANNLGIKDAENSYYNRNFGDNTNVDVYSVPSYWEASVTLENSEIDSNKRFCKYFILEVNCSDNQEGQEEKETDIIYFTVTRVN
ncbi:MAG: hypothetical protein IKQ63_06300 [Eubacterium sp.]|nr:hypothetical protein [Eubacterium sp.]